MLKHYVEYKQQDWAYLLPLMQFAYNNSYQQSIRTTPFILNYGYSPNTIVDIALSKDKPAIANYIYDLHECWKVAATHIAHSQLQQAH